MSEPLSHRFLEALAEPRDRFFALALSRAGSPRAAEGVLQETARQIFTRVAAGEALDIEGEMDKALGANNDGGGETPDSSPTNGVTTASMPADVWARVAAAVQIEAARSHHSQALNPDSVLLSPDPLLAPKKTKPRNEGEDFDVSSPSKLIVALVVVLLVGIVVTVYILTRPGPASSGAGEKSPSPASSPSTQPAGQP